jgi:hypothetical protein
MGLFDKAGVYVIVKAACAGERQRAQRQPESDKEIVRWCLIVGERMMLRRGLRGLEICDRSDAHASDLTGVGLANANMLIRCEATTGAQLLISLRSRKFLIVGLDHVTASGMSHSPIHSDWKWLVLEDTSISSHHFRATISTPLPAPQKTHANPSQPYPSEAAPANH